MTIPKLGIDVDMTHFVVCLLFDDQTMRKRKFENNPSGFDELDRWLKCERVMAVMEATGRYGERLAEHLHKRGNTVAVVNPAFVARHKQALNRQNKTDPGDAQAIADYARCFETKLRAWKPLTPVIEQLRDVQGQIMLLKKTITAFRNRGGCGLRSEPVQASNAATIEHLERQLLVLEELREQLFDSLPELREIREILCGVPGIGEEVSAALAAKIRFEDFTSGRQLAVFLGCGSSQWQSGKQRKPGKQGKAGDKAMRSLVRQGAASAMRSAYYRPFVERLRKKGLKPKQIVGAVARKILVLAHAVVRKKQHFDRFYEHPLDKRVA